MTPEEIEQLPAEDRAKAYKGLCELYEKKLRCALSMLYEVNRWNELGLIDYVPEWSKEQVMETWGRIDKYLKDFDKIGEMPEEKEKQNER